MPTIDTLDALGPNLGDAITTTCALYIPKVCQRYAHKMPKICPKNAKDMQKICLRYAQ